MTRIAPVLLLCCLSPSAQGQEKSVKEYADSLKNSEPRVRLAGLAGLAEAGAAAAAHVDAIAKLLNDPFVQVRRAALSVLSILGPEAGKAAPAVAAALKDSDPAVRQLAHKALIDIGPKSLPALQNMLKESDGNVRLLAVIVIDALAADNPEAAKVLTLALKDVLPKVRMLALGGLAKLGASAKDSKDILQGLALGLTDKNTEIRTAASTALLELDKPGAVLLFLKALKDMTPDVRRTAVQALGSIGDELDMAGILGLRAALTDEDAKVRQYAAAAIAKAGVRARELGEGKKLTDILFKTMSDKEANVRQAAAYALGHVGIDNKEEIKKLAEGLKDSYPLVRGYTVQALAQYSHEDAPEDWRHFVLAHVAQALKDKDKRVTLAAAKVLVGEKAFAVPGLIKMVETTTGPPRFLAAQVLAEIGEDAKDAVPALQKMSMEGVPENRQTALFALKKIIP